MLPTAAPVRHTLMQLCQAQTRLAGVCAEGVAQPECLLGFAGGFSPRRSCMRERVDVASAVSAGHVAILNYPAFVPDCFDVAELASSNVRDRFSLR